MRHPLFCLVPSARLRASRRQCARAGEHDRGQAFDNGLALGADGASSSTSAARATASSWCITTPRWIGPPRCAGRSRRGPQLQRPRLSDGVPALADVLARSRDTPIIGELKLNEAAFAAEVLDLIRAAGAVDRVCVSDRSARACCARRARSSRLDCYERVARRGPLGALSVVVPLAGVARRLRRLSDPGAGRHDARRLAAVRHRCASRRTRRPGLDGRCRGRDCARGCLPGASMR